MIKSPPNFLAGFVCGALAMLLVVIFFPHNNNAPTPTTAAPQPTVTVPGQLSPKNGAKIAHETEVELFTSKVTGKTEHRVELSSVPGKGPYTTVMYPHGWNQRDSFWIGQMHTGMHQWRVQERTDGIVTDWSEYWVFVIGPDTKLVTSLTITGNANTFTPGQRIEATVSFQNNGENEWSPMRLGIKVDGPEVGGKNYLDLGWLVDPRVLPNASITFNEVIPNAPDFPGDYTLRATWQDKNGDWWSLGDIVPFKIQAK